MALKRLEELLDAQGRKDAQSGTDDTPLCGVECGENKSQHKSTKETKNQRVKPPRKPAFLILKILNATN